MSGSTWTCEWCGRVHRTSAAYFDHKDRCPTRLESFRRNSDYTKLVDALRLIRRQGSLPDQEIAEAALLSAGEEL